MEKSCSECTEPTLAQSLCTLCNKWLCYKCTDVHQHQRAQYTDSHQQQQQQQRPSASQCADLHQRGSSSLPPTGQGPGSYPCSLLMCHAHRQEPLELFCESCDLLCCSSCHLSSHKNHRVMQIGKALQDQQWLFESLMVQVEERRSAVESNAKQIEDRLHGVKITHRKAENQIKMAKMIMINELNKRANLLIEQLEKISEGFQQRLEDQLQGAIEMCGQLDHVQKFITWATTHHCRGPVLFSRALISLQMQQLLEAPLHSDAWSPVKIKFNWDASYWTKQISSLGQLSVEGGNCTYPPGLACSSIMRPQPISCMAAPSVFHRGRESGCGYQACCEPQMCCLHGVPAQQEMPSLDKSQLEASLYSSSCSQPAAISSSLHQGQQLQRCWDMQGASQCPPPSSPVPIAGPIQLGCSRASASQPRAPDSQPHCPSKAYLSYHQQQREIVPDSQVQLGADRGSASQCQGKLPASTPPQQELSHAAVDRDVETEDSWEDRRSVEESCEQTAAEEEQQQQRDRRAQSPVQPQRQQQPHVSAAAEQRRELQRTRMALMLRDHRGGRRSTSLEVSVTAHECVSDVPSSRLSPSSVCSRRKRRSQSIPTELATPSTSLRAERPPRCAHSPQAGAAEKHGVTDPRQRRASDGVLCTVKGTLSDPCKGQLCPLLSYKTEPDPLIFVNEETDLKAKEKCRLSTNSHNSIQKDSGRSRVPVVCLERLKILVSQLPPHGRRQSDPLPASGTNKAEAPAQQRAWHDATPGGCSEYSPVNPGIAGGSANRRTTRSLTAPPYAERQTLWSNSDFNSNNNRRRLSSHETAALSSTDSKYAPQSYPALELDSDSDPRSATEDVVVSAGDPDPHLDSDDSPESDPNTQSSSEGELECLAEGKSAAAADSDPSFEYEAEPESDAGGGSEDGRGLDADAESGDAESESDVQPEYEQDIQAETDSDAASDQPLESQGSAESDAEAQSERELTADDPQPLRSDLEEDSQTGPGQRQFLIANPDEVQSEQDSAEMESEDFCAVCLIGGDLLCCDRCPKVFHLSCHIPPLLSFPTGDWVCSLCRDTDHPEVEYNCENERASGQQASAHGLSACDQRKCERLTLLILSNVLSAPFHEPVSPLARHYYQIIKRPMDLSVIRTKLNKANGWHYNSPDQFVADVCLMFRNCAKFNYPDSEVAQAGRSLEVFFTSKLKQVFPDRVFPVAEADSDSDEYDEAYRATESGFPWPERREQCHRKRKRRQSLRSRRHHF